MTVPYAANIDIRDTVKYKQVMKEYRLGPNGAILTCLNLICTKFNQVCFFPFHSGVAVAYLQSQ